MCWLAAMYLFDSERLMSLNVSFLVWSKETTNFAAFAAQHSLSQRTYKIQR